MSILYTLNDNLDCNKICKDIENLLKKKMKQGPINNCVLTIGLSSLIDSQEKSQTPLLSYKDNNYDTGKNSS